MRRVPVITAYVLKVETQFVEARLYLDYSAKKIIY